MKRLTLFCFILFQYTGFALQPPRKALMGLLLSPVKEGLRIDSVMPNSTAAALKLKKNDVLRVFNDAPINSLDAYYQLASQVRTDEPVKLELVRNDKKILVSGKGVIRPYEISDIADVSYDWVKFRQGYLRTITRRPKGKTNVPCILLIPGYGCGSIENYSNSYNGRLMNEWLKNGYAVVTIEKSGLGDSYNCAPCSEADLATDIESFDAGYSYMEQLPFADKTKLFIWGHSLGGMVAPEIAHRHSPRGVMVFGTVFRPWSEFLLEMHRVQKPLLEGMSYEKTEEFTRLIQKVYFEFFVLKRSREQLYENPAYRDIVAGELEYKAGSNNMWGRHWRFWQQIDSLDLAKTWSELNCPVLVINGGTDYEQCAPIEPLLIEKTVNAAHPNYATRLQIADLDHFMMKSNSYEEAAKNFKEQQYTKGNFNRRIAEETIGWLNKNIQ